MASSRVFTMLENNPEVMNELAHSLGLSKELSFYDVYSLDDPDLLALVPRPVSALLVIIPMTPAWHANRQAEDAAADWHTGGGPDEPVFWIRQTITDGCGLIGMLCCALNGTASGMVVRGSKLHNFYESTKGLEREQRASFLQQSDDMYYASQAVGAKGDTEPPPNFEAARAIHQHFVALVKGSNGHLWELEGSRRGPLDRGALAADEDALSETALRLGLKRLIHLQEQDGGGDVRFSCIALAPTSRH